MDEIVINPSGRKRIMGAILVAGSCLVFIILGLLMFKEHPVEMGVAIIVFGYFLFFIIRGKIFSNIGKIRILKDGLKTSIPFVGKEEIFIPWIAINDVWIQKIQGVGGIYFSLKNVDQFPQIKSFKNSPSFNFLKSTAGVIVPRGKIDQMQKDIFNKEFDFNLGDYYEMPLEKIAALIKERILKV
jgi:hypothetical protein